MGMWSILEEGRGYEGFNQRGGSELEMAYKNLSKTLPISLI